jgi:hypothetical protein
MPMNLNDHMATTTNTRVARETRSQEVKNILYRAREIRFEMTMRGVPEKEQKLFARENQVRS